MCPLGQWQCPLGEPEWRRSSYSRSQGCSGAPAGLEQRRSGAGGQRSGGRTQSQCVLSGPVSSDWTRPVKHEDSPLPDARGRRARGQEECVGTPEGPATVWSAEEDTQPQGVAGATTSHQSEARTTPSGCYREPQLRPAASWGDVPETHLSSDGVVCQDVQQLVKDFEPGQVAAREDESLRWTLRTPPRGHRLSVWDRQALSPEEAVAGVGGRGQAAETEPLFALNVRQHEGEVLSHLVDRQAGQETGETQVRHR